MLKKYQQLKVELSKKELKPVYFFANCPKIIFRDLLSSIKENMGKKTEVFSISSQKEKISDFFYSQGFFYSKKIVILDLETFSPSPHQFEEIYGILKKYSKSERSSGRVLVVRTERKPVPKNISELAEDLQVFFWVIWTYEDIMFILKTLFPDVKLTDDAENFLKNLFQFNVDLVSVLKKAVIYSYPKKYLNREDIASVLSDELSMNIRKFAIQVLEGNLKNFPIMERSEDINLILSTLSSYFFSFVRLKVDGSARGSLKKIQIENEFKTKDIDKIIASMKRANSSDIVHGFLDVLFRSRAGNYSLSFYLFRFLKDFSDAVKT
jgi:DNA polymerase III delta subunit